jgi:hypothetical protein
MAAGGPRVPFYQSGMYNIGQRVGATRAGVGISRFTPPTITGVGTMAADATRQLSQGSRIWYQDAALKGDQMFDRRSIFRGADNMVQRASGAVSSAFGAWTNPSQGGFTKTFLTPAMKRRLNSIRRGNRGTGSVEVSFASSNPVEWDNWPSLGSLPSDEDSFR